MNKKNILILLVVSSLSFVSMDCNDSPPVTIDPPPSEPDTTSHNFVWTIDTLGDGNSSVLYDVAIINDTLIYAVGEIYLKDSTGQIDPQPYNLAVWNGKKWKFKKLYYTTTSSDSLLLYNIRGIWYLSPTEIWFAAGSIFRWDGTSTKAQLSFSRLTLPDPNATIEKLWGIQNYLYGVGNAGSIVHYNGTGWSKVESGTTFGFWDIWGVKEGETTEILGIARNSNKGKLIKITGTQASIILESGSIAQIVSLWFSKQKYYGVGAGIFTTDSVHRTQWSGSFGELTSNESYAVRGSSPKNVFVVGEFGDVLHYNGSTWKKYEQLQMNARLHAVSVTQSLIVAVGFMGGINGGAPVIRGKSK